MENQRLNKQQSHWKLLDCSHVNLFVSSLSHEERITLYNKMTQDFTITTKNSNNSVQKTWEIKGGSPHFASKLSPLPFYKRMIILIYITTNMILYAFPIFYTLYGIYLIYYLQFIKTLIWLIIYLYLLFYPHKKWETFFNNPLYVLTLQYFSWKCAWHPSVTDYIEKQKQSNTECNRPVIFISLPHGVVPMASIMSQVVLPDLFSDNFRGVSADIVFRLPFLRCILLWNGAISASKQTIIKNIANGHNIGIVSDGISGMFVKSTDKEVVLMKNKKGVAKLALQTNTHVVAGYGFGNTSVWDPIFDSYGIMKWLSQKLKMSIILFKGRWYTPIPKRVPLYLTIGPLIKNPYDKAIPSPTQKQIDDFHAMILDSIQFTFNEHKHLYGWQNKQLIFQ